VEIIEEIVLDGMHDYFFRRDIKNRHETGFYIPFHVCVGNLYFIVDSVGKPNFARISSDIGIAFKLPS